MSDMTRSYSNLLSSSASRLVLLGVLLLASYPLIAHEPARTTASTDDHSDLDKYADIQYRDIPNVEPDLLSLDVYVPENATDHMPVMIWVHGCAWRSGDKENQLVTKVSMFVDAGWIFVSVNYRLSPYEIPDDPAVFDPDRVVYPIHNQDVAAAIAWVYNHNSAYGGDHDQISLMGHSAGAGIVAAIGTYQRFLKDNGLDLGVLKHVVCIDTEGYDVREQIENGTKSQSMLYMNAFGTNPSVWDDASPIDNIELGEAIPPYFIVTRGAKDRVSLSERFSARLDEIDQRLN